MWWCDTGEKDLEHWIKSDTEKQRWHIFPENVALTDTTQNKDRLKAKGWKRNKCKQKKRGNRHSAFSYLFPQISSPQICWTLFSKHFNPFVFVSFCASPKSSGLIPEKATSLILRNYLFCKNEITNKRISLQPMYGSVRECCGLALVLLPV